MLIHGFARIALILNAIIIIVCAVVLFATTDSYGIYAAGICSISALLNCVGLTLLIRNRYIGLFIVAVASIASSIALSLTCNGWLRLCLGDIGYLIPYMVCILYIGIILILLFIKHKNGNAWKQMAGGLDYAHFRHIYQLSTCVLIGIIVTFYIMMPEGTVLKSSDNDNIEKYVSNIEPKRLDSPDVTIDEVVSFENQYYESHEVSERDLKVSRRVFALKHLLLSGLMPDYHTRDILVNIFMAHAGEYSKEQQMIIDWYLSLPLSDQEEWNVCEKAYSLSEFKKHINNRIQK